MFYIYIYIYIYIYTLYRMLNAKESGFPLLLEDINCVSTLAVTHLNNF